jgi:DNA polymerase-3 subunit gamma/tau
VSYQVFARKYRPQIFDDVVGQDHITRTLKNAIAQNRLAHAYLFVGPRGTGKTSTARILAKALCCIHAPTTEPCGVCDPCKEIAAGNSLDVLEIDGASNNGVEQVRELRENVRYAPARGRYKIYIIDEVHMLTPAAFNALLKTLEEPPDHVKFIFATTEPQKVLATILSRCQRFDLRRIPAQLIAAHLQKIAGLEKIALSPDAAEAIARGAEGGLRDAESMLDQLVAFCGNQIAREDVLHIFGFTPPETVAALAEHILAGDNPSALAALDAQSESGKDLSRLMAELIGHFRNLLVAQVNPGSLSADMPEALASVLAGQAARISPERLLELIDQFAAAEGRMKWAPNKKLHFEIALIKAIQTLGQATLTEVIDALTALRDEGAPSSSPARPPAKIASTPKASPAPVVAEAPPADFASLKKVLSPAAEAPVLEPAPLPKPLAPLPKPLAEKVEPAPAAPAADPTFLWLSLIQEIQTQRPLITSWVKLGRPIALENGTLRAGFPRGQKMVVESLGKANNRKFLEDLLARFAGAPVSLRLELEDREDGPEDTGHSPVPGGIPPADPALGSSPGPRFSVVKTEDPVESFRNDPLIQKALKVFEGEIRSVEGPPKISGAAGE